MASKDQKVFLRDLKCVYQAEQELEKLDETWGAKYPVVLSSWKNNWENLTAYFDYDEHIHRLIYTTNPVEGFHRQVRKVTKTKGVFPNDMVLLKLICLATKNIAKKWMPPSNWVLTSQQLHIKFGERKPLSLQYPTLKHKERNRDRNNQGLINTDSRCPCIFPTRFQKSIWELKTKK